MDEPSRHWRDNPNSAFSCRELRAGKFRLLAFDDGYWRIEISHHSIRACASDRLCESRTAAELAAEGVLRNLLDDALSFLNDGKTGR